MHRFEAMKSSNVHFTFFRMGKILEGLLAGAVEAEVPHGVECLRDAKHTWERIGGVVDQFKVASFNSVLHAVEDLGNVIHDVSQQLEQCKATVGIDCSLSPSADFRRNLLRNVHRQRSGGSRLFLCLLC